MPIRDWITVKLTNERDEGNLDLTDVIHVGDFGLKITRNNRPPAHVYAIEDRENPFTAKNLDDAIADFPELQFVVAINATIPVANATYAHADDLNIPIESFGYLIAALRELCHIENYRTRNHAYVHSRLSANVHVARVRRVGYDAYRIERRGISGPLVIVTLDPYEVTQEQINRIVIEHDEFEIDTLVTTNPNCRGFSATTLEAASSAGVEIQTLNQFLNSMNTL